MSSYLYRILFNTPLQVAHFNMFFICLATFLHLLSCSSLLTPFCPPQLLASYLSPTYIHIKDCIIIHISIPRFLTYNACNMLFFVWKPLECCIQGQRKIDNWGGGIFIYSCSAPVFSQQPRTQGNLPRTSAKGGKISEMNITGTLPPLLFIAKTWSQILRVTSPRHACLGEVSRESASRQSRELIIRSDAYDKLVFFHCEKCFFGLKASNISG